MTLQDYDALENGWEDGQLTALDGCYRASRTYKRVLKPD